MMTDNYLYVLIKDLIRRIEKIEEKIAAGLDDKSLTEVKRLEELKEIEYEKQDRLNAAIDYLSEYDCYSRYVENLSIVLDRLEELQTLHKKNDTDFLKI